MELFLAFLVAALVVVAVSHQRNPLKVCPKCKGAGMLPSGIRSRRYRPCPRCGRKGEISTR
ncbi:hypothetical protein [Streptosporangium pseudovulgare]|uniref:Uncharacterized protein n=1 Tax=Streptosporangium pseudovulgare TaxID=35765 RepID=A0ABQ2R341_9ACTN|nr:hypothetical protein [Streptosporangium pseudovulgare]GGQ11326.1 hypothetical protein GCM10010140_46850 [Streptosporangium pseudovulgare]